MASAKQARREDIYIAKEKAVCPKILGPKLSWSRYTA
jgi:hypothetical protein